MAGIAGGKVVTVTSGGRAVAEPMCSVLGSDLL
jgi:hypothetical protein